MKAPHLFKTFVASMICFSSLAFGAEGNPYNNRTLGIEILRTTDGLRGTVLPDRNIKVKLQCKFFSASKLVIAASPGESVDEKWWVSNRSILPNPRAAISYELSEPAASILCANKYHEDYVISFIGNRAYVSGIDHNFSVVAEAVDWAQ